MAKTIAMPSRSATVRSSAALDRSPLHLAAGGELYGVTVVYATEPISERERNAIQTIAATASHVLETIAIRGRLDQRERALHRYERLVETAGDGMYVLDDAGHFTTVNDALVEMTGYSREGLLGEHASILFDREDVTAATALIRSLLETESHTETIELPLETKAGERILRGSDRGPRSRR